MRKMKRLAAAAMLAATAGTVPALASQPGYYITAEGGATLVPDQDLMPLTGHRSQDSFNTGYIFGAAGGYDFGNGTRIELEPLTAQSNLESVNGMSSTGHLDASGFMFNGSFDLLSNAAVTPYVGAGIGVLDVGADLGGIRDDNWKPAYQLKAGFRHKLGDNLAVSAEYRYMQSEASRIAGLGNQHFADNAVLVGLTYHFGP